MARGALRGWGLLALALALALLRGAPHLPGAAAAKAAPRREDVPLILCPVCQHTARNILEQVEQKRREAAPKKLSELNILEVTERVCDVSRDQGDWIQWLDIVEKGSYLELEEYPFVGECGVECKTIQKACNEIMGFADTDVAEVLHGNPDITQEGLTAYLCKERTDVCAKPRAQIPKGRKPGEPFRRKSAKEVERQRMMRDIEGKQELYAQEHPNGPRMPKMKLYSRDDLMKKQMMGKSEDDDDDDEDEDEDEDNSGAAAAETDPQLRAISEAMRKAQEATDLAPQPWWEKTWAQLGRALEEPIQSLRKAVPSAYRPHFDRSIEAATAAAQDLKSVLQRVFRPASKALPKQEL